MPVLVGRVETRSVPSKVSSRSSERSGHFYIPGDKDNGRSVRHRDCMTKEWGGKRAEGYHACWCLQHSSNSNSI